jgi:hypothetical protein
MKQRQVPLPQEELLPIPEQEVPQSVREAVEHGRELAEAVNEITIPPKLRMKERICHCLVRGCEVGSFLERWVPEGEESAVPAAMSLGWHPKED